MLTKKQIQTELTKLVQASGERESIFIAYELGDSIKSSKTDILEFTEEESVGGSEGSGEYCCKVFKVTELDSKQEVYIRFEGYYSSYDGAEYENGFDLVEPVMVQVRQFKKIK